MSSQLIQMLILGETYFLNINISYKKWKESFTN